MANPAARPPRRATATAEPTSRGWCPGAQALASAPAAAASSSGSGGACPAAADQHRRSSSLGAAAAASTSGCSGGLRHLQLPGALPAWGPRHGRARWARLSAAAAKCGSLEELLSNVELFVKGEVFNYRLYNYCFMLSIEQVGHRGRKAGLAGARGAWAGWLAGGHPSGVERWVAASDATAMPAGMCGPKGRGYGGRLPSQGVARPRAGWVSVTGVDGRAVLGARASPVRGVSYGTGVQAGT